MKKRIVFIDHTSRIGGAQLSLLDIAEYYKDESKVLLFGHGEFEKLLKNLDVETSICDLDETLYPLKRNVGFINILKAVPAVLKKMFVLRREISEYEVIYANSFKSFIITSLASLGLRRKRVLHLRDALTSENFSQIVIKCVIQISKLLKVNVIANSNYTMDCFIDNGGMREKCSVIWNGVDDEPFRNIPPVSFKNNIINILSLGRISPWKGQHIVIESIINLPNAHLRIVGSPNFGEDEYYQSLKNIVYENKIEDRVTFHDFSLNVEEQLNWCDIFIHSSTSPEPFGRVIVEAMLAGRVVVATNAGGVPEIVSNPDIGILVPPDDSKEIEGVLKKIESNKKHYAKVALNGRNHANSNFTLRTLFNNLDKFLNRI